VLGPAQQGTSLTYLDGLNTSEVVAQLHHHVLPALVVRLALPNTQFVVLVPAVLDALAIRGAVKCVHFALCE
jgi:hypothetical protein